MFNRTDLVKSTRSGGHAALLMAGLGCLLLTPIFAQQPATISGFVADPSGAGVPGASLTLTNQDTAVVVINTKTDTDGNFTFTAVPAPATYSISVQFGGFTRQEQKDVVVTSGERRSVGTLSLVVGNITDSVTVQANTTPVQTQSAERSASLDRHEIGALLARGLNYGSLAEESSRSFGRSGSEWARRKHHDL